MQVLLTVKCHDFAQVMYQAGEMKPIVFWKFLTGPLCRLKCMHNVRQRRIGIAFIDQIVQFLERLTDCHFGMIEFQPLVVAFCFESGWERERKGLDGGDKLVGTMEHQFIN
jgi:hypothetical protein